MNIDEHHSTYLTPSISHLKSFLHLVCCLYFVERDRTSSSSFPNAY